MNTRFDSSDLNTGFFELFVETSFQCFVGVLCDPIIYSKTLRRDFVEEMQNVIWALPMSQTVQGSKHNVIH